MKRGFTLIELLVVIAIIAVLAAILFPVFARARGKAQQTTCTSNQRQIAATLLMYAQDHEEALPPASNWTQYVGEAGVLHCPTVSGTGPDYLYNAGSHLSGQGLGTYNSPSEVLMTADSAMPGIVNLTNCDGGTGSADVVISGAYNRMISTYFAINRHSNGLTASFLDGHVDFMRTDTNAVLSSLQTYINNAKASNEPIPTAYLTTVANSNCVAPANTIFGGGYFGASSPGTLSTTTPAKPGFSLLFPPAGGPSLNRCANLNMSACGIASTTRWCQTCSSGLVRANLLMNFTPGQGGTLHISWGSWTDNSSGGASLTVTDNTSGTVFDNTISSALSCFQAYNTGWLYYESTFKVGACQNMNIDVRDTQTAGRAWLLGVWITP